MSGVCRFLGVVLLSMGVVWSAVGQHITDKAGKTYYDEAHTQLKEVYSYKERMSFHPDRPDRMKVERIRHGAYFKYYRSGRLMVAGKYAEGQPDGEWKYYSEDGTLIKREIYQNGRLVETIENEEP